MALAAIVGVVLNLVLPESKGDQDGIEIEEHI